MISFTDHYNAIFIDRFPSKTKIGKDSWYLNNSLLCKPEFSLTTKTFYFLIKNTKHNHFSASDWLENTKSTFKEDVTYFSEISRKYYNYNTEKKTAKLIQKKKASNQKLNR